MAVVAGHPGEGESWAESGAQETGKGDLGGGHWTSQGLACLLSGSLLGRGSFDYCHGTHSLHIPSLSPAPAAYPSVPRGLNTSQTSLCAYHGNE